MGGPRQVRDARPDFRPPDFKQGGRACDWAASGTAAARALGQHPPTVIAPGLGGKVYNLPRVWAHYMGTVLYRNESQLARMRRRAL